MYLITQPGTEPFLTKYFDPENHWQSGMVVFNIVTCEYTTDGVNWQPLNEDQL